MSDEQNGQPMTPAEWHAYWLSVNPSWTWRTEPEIDDSRKAELDARLKPPSSESRSYPFEGMQLHRADVEHLLATHENGRGPVDWDDKSQRNRDGLDVRGAILRDADLRRLPLAGLVGGWHLSPGQVSFLTEEQRDMQLRVRVAVDMRGAKLYETDLRGARLGYAHMEDVVMVGARLDGAHLLWAHLERANMVEAHLTDAILGSARMEQANLGRAHLEAAFLGGADLRGANLWEAYLQGAFLQAAHLQGANLTDTHLDGKGAPWDQSEFAHQLVAGRQKELEYLPPANLRGAIMDVETTLSNIQLGSQSLADVMWNGVNLAGVDWTTAAVLGDELLANQAKDYNGAAKDQTKRAHEYEAAVRANRQLAVALQAQGMNEEAARRAYRAQVLQRKVFWRQRNKRLWWLWRLFACGFSWFLSIIAGYGYKPERTLCWYLFVLGVFWVGYHTLSQSPGMHPHFSVWGALVFSITSFHGRGFFPGNMSLDDPITKLAALEAVLGLFIEISFIAAFTRRYLS